MNKVNESQLNMFDAVIAYCTANATTVASVGAFQKAFTAFQSVVAQIRDTAQMEAVIISGIAADKSQFRLSLCQQATNLSAAVFTFAFETNNNQLQEQARFSLTDYKRLKDEKLALVCANLRDAINANITALATYSITPAVVTSFQAAIDAYQAKIASPRNAVSQRMTNAATLKNLFKKALGILKNQMDKMALQIKLTDEDFYMTYKTNRAIVDSKSSATQITGTVTSSVTHDPLQGATVEVVGQPLTAVTDQNGLYVLRSITPGNLSVKVTNTGYSDMQQNDVVVKLGKTTSADIAITPKAS